jgi:phosphatidylglycerol:prolipoprotein diacylglycerol transferase
VPRLAGLPLAVLLGGALLLATAQAPAPQRETPAASSLTVSGGMLGNYHDEELQVHYGGGSCNGGGGNSYTKYYNLYHRTLAGGADITSQQVRPNGHLREFGGGMWVGEQRTGYHFLGYTPSPFVVHPDSAIRSTLYDLHFFYGQEFGHDWLTLRYRVGLHAGMLGRYAYYPEAASSTNSQTNFAPEVMLRFGHPQLLFGQYDSGYGAENALGTYTTRVALGSGLGHADGRQVLLGYASAVHYSGPGMAFASANLRLPAGLSAVSLEPYFATDFDRHNIFSMKLHYQFGGK